MNNQIRLVGLVAMVALVLGGDLLACGDKFLVAGRGTRYQRPKTARAASVLIYANPASGLPATLRKVKVDAVLKHEGHRATTAETFEQLSALLAGGRFDVIVTSTSVAADVEKLLAGDPTKGVVLALNEPAKEQTFLRAIDKAVELRDQNARKAMTRS